MEGKTQTVLVVDDDPSVRALAVKVLRRQGYTVVEAGDGETALEYAATRPGQIALLLADVVLPGMSGEELANALRAANPRVSVVFMSGFAEDELTGMGIDGVGTRYISKPFTVDVLKMMVGGALTR
jgi:two-component system cell cycle sensor histidine kinase/response regulator CckA